MENIIEKIVIDMISRNPSTRAEFEHAHQKASGAERANQPKTQDLLRAYQTLTKNGSIPPDKTFEKFLKKADIRSMSGIAVVTSLVKPYNCPGKCVYCPTEVRMPKSYIASEPAAARALRLDFSPYEQMRRRILMLETNGHEVDKIEYIIKGGTWNAYPLKYQYWFILESFRACNDLTRGETEPYDEHLTIAEFQSKMRTEQSINESVKHRIIGLTLETRPDAINPRTIYHMRQMGATRIELGLQAPDDAILTLIVRGHTVEQFTDAMRLLRDAGFKVDLHFMPDLPGTTPEHDVEMYRSLFSNEKLRPDMVKIYPNTVIPSAELSEWYRDGRYTPYGNENLFHALLDMKRSTPRYCRISRLIRDIPANEIIAGNTVTNLREDLKKHLTKNGEFCICLRCREIGRHLTEIPENTTPTLFVEKYHTDGGDEYFLTLEDPARIAVYAFLRLRLPDERHTKISKIMPELTDSAFIRELHTYGIVVAVGNRVNSASQHKGMGKRLVHEAEKIAEVNKFSKVAVISGVGVRGYYKKLGYTLEGTYMVKSIPNI
jgi:elongator complex protein 3